MPKIGISENRTAEYLMYLRSGSRGKRDLQAKKRDCGFYATDRNFFLITVANLHIGS